MKHNPFISKKSYFDESASFLKGAKKRKLLSRWNKGLLIGTKKISIKNSLQGALVLAPTGQGKTVSYVIPNLLNIKNASAIVLDPSSEIYNLTANYLRSKKFDVKKLDINNPNESEKYNPLGSCKTKADIVQIADAIVDLAYPNTSSDGVFWNSGAAQIIRIISNSLKSDPAKFNLPEVYKLLNRLSFDKDFVNEHLSNTLDEELWNEYKGLLSNNEKVWGSFLGTAKVALASMGNPALEKIAYESSLDFNSLRRTPTVLFLCVPEHEIKFFSFYISLLFRDFFNEMMTLPSKKDLVVYALCDEAGNIRINQLDVFLTVLRKRKVSVSLILQSLQQLKTLYGESAPVIAENCLSHLYFGGISHETTVQLSQKLGMTFNKPEFSFFPTNKPDPFSKQKIPLMTAEAIRCMKPNNILYFYGNLPAVQVKLLPWYKSSSMKRKLRRN